MVSEKGSDWKLDLKTVNAINTFTGAKIPVSNAEEGNVVKMCEATKALVDEG